VCKWLKREPGPAVPVFIPTLIGTLEAPSGTLLLADPSDILDDSVRIEGVPPGRFDARGQIICYPEGGKRIAKVSFAFRPGEAESRDEIGRLGVDTGHAVAVDAGVCQRHWKVVGPERIGAVPLPNQKEVARLIQKRFGLTLRAGVEFGYEFEGPISEELEAQILAYVQTLPEYAEMPFLAFRVKTMNSLERLQAATRGSRWEEFVLDQTTGASLLAFNTGFGDGVYPVEGLYRATELLGVEVQFIGPAQDELLRAFPIFRY